MAKMKGTKSGSNKPQKEISSLKAKLNIALKQIDAMRKNSDKKHAEILKGLKMKVDAAKKAGFSEGLSSATKKEAAKKKALRHAELAFEKGYTKKPASKASATKVGVTKKKKVTKKVTKLSKSPKKALKAKKVVAKKATAKKATAKKAIAKRGRPSKSKRPAQLNEARQLQQKLFQPANQEIELL